MEKLSHSGLQFNKVKEQASVSLHTVASVRAILLYHGKAKEDNGGVSPVKLRQLIEFLNNPTINEVPLLKEYICAFGQHGLAVTERLLNDCDEQSLENAKALVTDYYQKLVRAFG